MLDVAFTETKKVRLYLIFDKLGMPLKGGFIFWSVTMRYTAKGSVGLTLIGEKRRVRPVACNKS